MCAALQINGNTPANYENVSSIVSQLTASYDFLTTSVYGYSVMGKPLRASCLGLGGRRVFFSAAHHGNEWLTTLVLLKFLAELSDKIANNTLFFGVPALTVFRYSRICLAPMVDPDGVDLALGVLNSGGYYEMARAIAEGFPAIPFPTGWKANIRGTDLNLQYPAGWELARQLKFAQGYDRPAPRDFVGFCPLCEPESQALADYTRRLDPYTVVALHSQGEVIYWRYADYEIPGALELGEKLARASGYTLSRTPPYSDNAGYKDWFIQDFRRPGYTVEVGLGENPLPTSQFDRIYSQVAPLLITAALG